MDSAALLGKIRERFADAQEVALPDPKWIRGAELQVKVPSARVAEVASYVKKDLGFDLLSFMTAVDWIKENRFEVVYYFMRSAEPVTKFYLKADLPRAGEPSVPSISHLYDGANWQERETYDLYGIRFDGHPDQRRILLWEGYPGWPLRKDYMHTPDKYDNGQEVGLPAEKPPQGGAAVPESPAKGTAPSTPGHAMPKDAPVAPSAGLQGQTAPQRGEGPVGKPPSSEGAGRSAERTAPAPGDQPPTRKEDAGPQMRPNTQQPPSGSSTGVK